MTKHDQSPANPASKGLSKSSVNAQISRFGAGLLDATCREIPRGLAGSARGYQERFASLVAWQSPLRPAGRRLSRIFMHRGGWAERPLMPLRARCV